MKKYSFSSMLLLVSVLFISLFSGCDEEEFVADDIRESVMTPEINDFSPKSGGAGTEITISGKNLATIDKAYIGDVETQILYRVSTTEIVLRVVGNEKTGAIQLFVDSENNSTSSQSFTVEHVTPSISSVLPDVTGFNARDIVTIKGSNLKSVLGFYFGEEEAKVEFLNDSEVKIQIPYAAAEKAKIRLKHYAPGAEKYVESAKEYDVLKKEVVVTDSSVGVQGTTITVTLIGNELDLISTLIYGEETELTITSQESDKVIATMSRGTMSGTVVRDLKIEDKHSRTKVLIKDFKVVL